jgi:hypothetical protein
MNAILVLLAVSAIVGLVLGFYFSFAAILVSGLVLAIVSATVLQNEGFDFLPEIAIVVVCLAVNQLAYLIGVRLMIRGPRKARPPGVAWPPVGCIALNSPNNIYCQPSARDPSAIG